MRRDRAVLGAAIGAAVVFAVSFGWSMTASPYAPEQPIDFSHRDHIRSDGLDCALCHSGARRSAFAGMPPVERCMGCHRVVLPSNPDVTRLRRYWDAGKSIPWVEGYSLPRFVRFNQEAHAHAHIACSARHGYVA